MRACVRACVFIFGVHVYHCLSSIIITRVKLVDVESPEYQVNRYVNNFKIVSPYPILYYRSLYREAKGSQDYLVPL